MKKNQKILQIAVLCLIILLLVSCESAEKYFNEGNDQSENREYEKAIDAYLKAIEIDMEYLEAYYKLGNAYAKLDQYEKAIDAYLKAIKGNVYDNSFIKAIKRIDLWLSPFESLNDNYLIAGNDYYDSGQYEKAIEAYIKAIILRPKIPKIYTIGGEYYPYSEVYYKLGNAYAKLAQYEKAIDAYLKAIEFYLQYEEKRPLMPIIDLHFYGNEREFVSMENGKDDYNIKELAKFYYNLGVSFSFLDLYYYAADFYIKAVDVDLNYKNSSFSFGDNVFEELEPSSAEEYYLLGFIYYSQGDKETAGSLYLQALEKAPEIAKRFNYQEYEFGEVTVKDEQTTPMASKYLREGLKNHEEGRIGEAITAYQKAIESDPGFSIAYNNLGNAYADLNQYDKAIDAYLKAIERDPNYADYYKNLGNTYIDLNQYDKAIGAYLKANEIDPEDANAYFNLGSTYIDLNQYNKAISAFQRAVELAPHDARGYYMLGQLYFYAQNDLSKAEKMLEQLETLDYELYLDLYNRIYQ